MKLRNELQRALRSAAWEPLYVSPEQRPDVPHATHEARVSYAGQALRVVRYSDRSVEFANVRLARFVKEK